MANLPNPRTADDDEVAGFQCYDCGHRWTGATGTTCPACGDDDDVAPVTFVTCGQHWHNGEVEAVRCWHRRTEAEREG